MIARDGITRGKITPRFFGIFPTCGLTLLVAHCINMATGNFHVTALRQIDPVPAGFNVYIIYNYTGTSESRNCIISPLPDIQITNFNIATQCKSNGILSSSVLNLTSAGQRRTIQCSGSVNFDIFQIFSPNQGCFPVIICPIH